MNEKRQSLVDLAHAEVSARVDTVLVAEGLGSTAALALYDPSARVGALLHWMLPSAGPDRARAERTPALFAESGIPWVLSEMERCGAQRQNLRAALAGAASLRGDVAYDLGGRNRVAARRLLRAAGITLEVEDVGGEVVRALSLDLASGAMSVRIPGAPEDDDQSGMVAA